MSAHENSLPNRRDALTMIAASAAVLVTPVQALTQPPKAIVVTMTRFAVPVSDQLTKSITARRRHRGFLSQKVLTSADGVVLIEEWSQRAAMGNETYTRKEI